MNELEGPPKLTAETDINLLAVSMYGKFPYGQDGFTEWGYTVDSLTGASRKMEPGQYQQAEQYRESNINRVLIASVVNNINPPRSALIFHSQGPRAAIVTHWGFLEMPHLGKGRIASQTFYRELDPDTIGLMVDNGYDLIRSLYHPQLAENNPDDFLAQTSVKAEKLNQTPAIFIEEKCRQLVVEIFLRLMKGQRVVVENINPATGKPLNTEEKILIGQTLMLMCRTAGQPEAMKVWATDPILKVPASLIFRESEDRPWHIPGYSFDEVYYLDPRQEYAQISDDPSKAALAESFKQSQWSDVIAALKRTIEANGEYLEKDKLPSKTMEVEIPMRYRLEQAATGQLFDKIKALAAKSATPVQMIERELDKLPKKPFQRGPGNRVIAAKQYQRIAADCIEAADMAEYVTPTLGFIFNKGLKKEEYTPVLHNAGESFAREFVRRISLKARDMVSAQAGQLTPDQINAIQKAIDDFPIYFDGGFRVKNGELQLFDFGDDGREFMIKLD